MYFGGRGNLNAENLNTGGAKRAEGRTWKGIILYTESGRTSCCCRCVVVYGRRVAPTGRDLRLDSADVEGTTRWPPPPPEQRPSPPPPSSVCRRCLPLGCYQPPVYNNRGRRRRDRVTRTLFSVCVFFQIFSPSAKYHTTIRNPVVVLSIISYVLSVDSVFHLHSLPSRAHNVSVYLRICMYSIGRVVGRTDSIYASTTTGRGNNRFPSKICLMMMMKMVLEMRRVWPES